MTVSSLEKASLCIVSPDESNKPMIHSTLSHSLLHAALLGIAAAASSALAGDYGKVVIDDKIPIEPSSFCDIFDRAVLYENKDFLPFQKFAFTGRLQADAAFFEADQGDYDSLEWRRARVGFKSKHFNYFTIHSEVDLELNDRDPLYGKLTDSYIAWSKSDELEIKLGKHGAPFTLDGATSSKSLLRMERSLLSTNLWFPEEYFTGASASGEVNNWIYNVGVFSSDGGKEYGDFEAGTFGLFSLGYDFADSLGVDKAILRGDYVHNDISGGGILNTRSLSDVGSINFTYEIGQFGLATDVAAAQGFGNQSDLFTVAVMPYYNLSDEWQLVGSYNYVTSEDPNGVRFDRYESRIESGRSDEAHEFYLGVNRYLCGQKLKWQAGVEYTTTNDRANDGGEYDGWGVSTGIRLSW